MLKFIYKGIAHSKFGIFVIIHKLKQIKNEIHKNDSLFNHKLSEWYHGSHSMLYYTYILLSELIILILAFVDSYLIIYVISMPTVAFKYNKVLWSTWVGIVSLIISILVLGFMNYETFKNVHSNSVSKLRLRIDVKIQMIKDYINNIYNHDKANYLNK